MTTDRTSKTFLSTRLLVQREEAIRKVKEQIEAGRRIREQRLSYMADLDIAQERRTKWIEDNARLLARLVTDPLLEGEYNMRDDLDLDSAITFSLKEKYFRDNIHEQIGRLESFLEHLRVIPEMTAQERMEQKLAEESMRREQPRGIDSVDARLRKALISEPQPPKEPAGEKPPAGPLPQGEPPREALPRKEPLREETPPAKISSVDQLPEGELLLIHGREEATKEEVLQFLNALGLQPIVLHDQPEGGKKLIEKLGVSSGKPFAIILLTPDDVAAPRHKPKERPLRVSQNVFFEFGYLLGKLGSERVCALCTEGVEIPAGDLGALCIPIDSRGTWRLLLAREMKQAGIDLDLNKAI